jgi:hypothetical protein
VAHLASLPENLRRIRLFFVSYFPLWVMLALRALPPHHTFQHWSLRTLAVVIFAALAISSLADAIRLIRGAQRTTPRTLYLGEIDSQGGNAAAYLATYLLPFLGIVPADLGDWLAYGVYLFVAIVVFINTDLALVNPTLYLMRRKIVSATAYLTEERSLEHRLSAAPVIIICRRPASLSDGPIDVVSLAGCYVTKREPAE